MRMGGNKRAFEFFKGYELMDEDSETRLSSEAANFYRKRLKALVHKSKFKLKAPLLENGRKPQGTVQYSGTNDEGKTMVEKGLGIVSKGAAAVGITSKIDRSSKFIQTKADFANLV